MTDETSTPSSEQGPSTPSARLPAAQNETPARTPTPSDPASAEAFVYPDLAFAEIREGVDPSYVARSTPSPAPPPAQGDDKGKS